MFHARIALAMAVIAGLLAPSAPIHAEDVNFIDGVGYVDYSRPPDFEIGSWVKYEMAGTTALGREDAYTLTISVAGEENFWGEDCFWIETVTQRGTEPIPLASCISYAAFGDSLRDKPLLFERKTIIGLGEDGKPAQNVMRRSGSSYRSREKRGSVVVTFDTLGTDTVMVPRGTFDCLKVRRTEGVYVEREEGDSTFRGETYDIRTFYYAPEIPITSLVREDLENRIIRKAWKVGESDKQVESVVDHAFGSMRLVDWGDGATAELVPEAYRKPLKRAGTRGRARSGSGGG